MSSQRTLARAGVPVAVTMLAGALGVAASPAAYAEESPSPKPSTTASPSASPTPTNEPEPKPAPADLAVRLATDKVAVDSDGKIMRVDVLNAGPETAKRVTLTLDLSGLGDQVEIGVHKDPNCTTKGKIITCAYQNVRSGATRPTAFKVKPVEGARKGAAGTVKASVASGQPDPRKGNNSDAATIEIVDSAVDLVAAAVDVGPVKPGGTAVLEWAFGNFGDTAAKGISLKLTLPRYATFTDNYKDCTTSKNRRQMVCVAKDAVVNPGDVIAWNTEGVKPVHVKVAKDAPGPISLGLGSFVSAALGEVKPQPHSGSGSQMMAAESDSRNTAPEVDGDDNVANFAVLTKKNPADLSVSAPKATGQVGDVVKLTVTVTNHGPADANGFVARMSLPAGTKLTKVPGACRAKQRTLVCNAGDMLDNGESAEQDLLLKITSKQLADGSAKVETNKIPDSKPGNNTTKLRVAIGTGGSGGGLPVTGASLTGLLGGGLLAVLLGGALFLVTRRRRTT